MSFLSNLEFQAYPIASVSEELSEKIARARKKGFSEGHLRLFTRLSQLKAEGKPQLLQAESLVFLGDHGIAKELDLAAFQPSIEQRVLDNLNRKSIIDLNPDQGLKHFYIDTGLSYAFESNFNYWLNHSNKLISSKVKPGTASFSLYPAMTDGELRQAFDLGKKLVDRAHYNDLNLIFLAGGGQGEVASSLALLKALNPEADISELNKDPNFALSAENLEKIDKAFKKHPLSSEAFHNACFYGGLEGAALLGAILRCLEKGLIFICTDRLSSIMWRYAQEIKSEALQFGLLLDAKQASLFNKAVSWITSDYPSSMQAEPLFFLWALLQSELKRFHQE